MAKLRISVVQYLNTAPLVRGFTHGPLKGKYDLSFTVPSQCAEALRGGAADIAIIPAIEYQRIPDLAILPDLSIASKERVRSLLVVSRGPIRFARKIALDRSSRSTQALTRILAANRWNISPEFREAEPELEKMLANSDAALVIGDPALRIAIAAEKKTKPGRDGEWICEGATVGLPQFSTLHIYDVVREWWQMTERPAVLAVWAARKEIVTEELADEFLDSLNFGMENLDAICKEAAAEMNLPEKELKLYLKTNIDYSLDDENRKGLLAYYSHAVKLGLLEKLNPITIAGRSGVPARHMDFTWAQSPAKS
ncbi:MAG: menaquinone biosynthesis protein [Acidobacteria bacterium]|nr:menaquinone biosynthesis protein [Acidobacteriota bacterium]MBS1865207.1 menaquinone biosynthesis protein [Acidobacteriota bacterium]